MIPSSINKVNSSFALLTEEKKSLKERKTNGIYRLPDEIFDDIASFLTPKELNTLSKCSFLLAASIPEKDYVKKWTSIKLRVNRIGAFMLIHSLKQLIGDIIQSPFRGSRPWIKALDKPMHFFLGQYLCIDDLVARNKTLFELIQKASLTEAEASPFYQYLIQRLKHFYPWIVYSFMEIFIGLHETVVKSILQEFLAGEAKRALIPKEMSLTFNETPYKYLTLSIQLNYWYGLDAAKSSLWNGNKTLPKIFENILYEHILEIKASTKLPLEVKLTGYAISHLPHNFIFELAKRLVQKRIFVRHDNGLDAFLLGPYANAIAENIPLFLKQAAI